MGFEVVLEHIIPEGANTVQSMNVNTTLRGYGGVSRSMWAHIDNWPSSYAKALNWVIDDIWDGGYTPDVAISESGRRMCEAVFDNVAKIGTA